jgi:predicted ATP-grasp superfamily ATP-dependent carboligase
MDFLDPLTADFPSRNILPEEDEVAFELHMEEQYVAKPSIEWDPIFLKSLPSTVSVVLLCGKVGCCIKSALVDGACMGRISLPRLRHVASAQESILGKGRIVSNIHKGLYSTLVICVEDVPAQEQATAWVDTVFDACRVSSVVVVGSFPGYRYKGAFDGSDQDQIFCLRTHSKPSGHACKPLPLGNLLSGIEAASMLYCELENIRASAIIAVELSQCPRYDMACSLGEVLMSELGEPGLSPEAKKCIKQFTTQQYATSADLSVYV